MIQKQCEHAGDTNVCDCFEEHRDVWGKLADAVSCGYCGKTTTRDSEYTCEKCGRILCAECGDLWGWCKDHIPACTGDSMFHPPVRMVGSCKHNMSCPVCGSGWGQAPCSHSPEIVYTIQES